MILSGGETNAGRLRPFVRPAGVAALFLLFVLTLGGVSAQTPAVSPRAALHDGFARIVFDWDAPVGYSAEIVNGQLVAHFERPIKGNIQSLVKPLASVVRGASLSSDGQTASFPLIKAMTVKSFTGNNNSVVIDLQDDNKAAKAAPAAGPVTKTASAGVPTVTARANDHGGFVRLVFDWPSSVGYSVTQQPGHGTIAFTKSAQLDLAELQGGLPADVSAAVTPGKGLSLTLQLPAKATLRHFMSGNKVVIDVLRPTDSAAPVDSAKVPLSPQDLPKPADDSMKSGPSPVKPTMLDVAKDKPAGASALTAPATMAMTAPAAPSPALPTTGPPPAKTPVGAPPSAPIIVPPPSPPAPSNLPPAPPLEVYSLSIAMTKPAAAAVFERAGYLWMVFDRRQEIDTALLRRLGGKAVLAVEQIPNKDATVLRLVVQPDFYPSLRKEGLLWVVDLTNQFSKPKDIIPVVAPAMLPSGIGMSIKAPDSGSVIAIPDPEVGDVIKVVPVIPVWQGVYPGRDTPDLELLPSAQGIAIVAHVDGLDIRSTRSGVTIGMASGAGLRFSSDLDAAPKDANGAAIGKGLFDVANWKQGSPDSFEANRKIVAARLASATSSRRALANLQAARFYFANGKGSEALGYLRLAADDQPDLADTPNFKALKGAAETLMAQGDLATADLDNPALQDDTEAQMWRGAAHALDDEQPAAWDKALNGGLPLIKAYPHRLKWQILTAAVRAAVAAGDDQGAQQALNLLDREQLSKSEEPERYYLHGMYDEMAGHFEKAIDEYDNAADGNNRQYRALAKFASTELSLKTRKITPKEAADQLDKLRFSWREESFEFNLLLRYAELQHQAEDYPSALRALRSLINYYPDDKNTPKAIKMMSDIFNRLYLDGQADSMSPVSAIALYDEFRDLTPTGPQGDEMIRKLADRLAKVDLLDRAAELLKHQVTYRLQAVDKARVGAQLALLDLINQQPQAALEGLSLSEVNPEPDELRLQRRHLQARALSDLGRTPEAIAALDGDMSPEGAQLRAEIHWKAQDWPSAVSDFEAMVPRPDRGVTFDDATAKTCLSWATALVLANDERGLASLRRNYGGAMAGTSYRQGFNMLTSALDRDTPNLPDIVSKIKEAEGFKNFLTDYHKRLQEQGVSAIN